MDLEIDFHNWKQGAELAKVFWYLRGKARPNYDVERLTVGVGFPETWMWTSSQRGTAHCCMLLPGEWQVTWQYRVYWIFSVLHDLSSNYSFFCDGRVHLVCLASQSYQTDNKSIMSKISFPWLRCQKLGGMQKYSPVRSRIPWFLFPSETGIAVSPSRL